MQNIRKFKNEPDNKAIYPRDAVMYKTITNKLRRLLLEDMTV